MLSAPVPLNLYWESPIISLMPHFTYLARCGDGSLYTGTCLDIKARETKHNKGEGAKYTRSKLPIKIVYFEEFLTLPEARKREAQIKKLAKAKKEDLVKNFKQN